MEILSDRVKAAGRLRDEPAANALPLTFTKPGLVSSNRFVDFLAPDVDAAGHILSRRETVGAEVLDHAQTPATVMTVNDQCLVSVRF